jgi:hypothetical protein
LSSLSFAIVVLSRILSSRLLSSDASITSTSDLRSRTCLTTITHLIHSLAFAYKTLNTLLQQLIKHI